MAVVDNMLQGISGHEASRTVSLSDLYDDLCSSSSWLHSTSQETVAQISAVNSRTEPRIVGLSALLSCSSTSDAENLEASFNGSHTLPSHSGRLLQPAAPGNSTAAACDAVTADADPETNTATYQTGYAAHNSTNHSSASRQQQKQVRLNLVQQPGVQQQGQHRTPAQQAAGSPRSQQQQQHHQAVTTSQRQPNDSSPPGPASYADMLQFRRQRSSPATTPRITSPRTAGKLLPAPAAAAAQPAAQAPPAAAAVVAEPGSKGASQKELTERKLVKCLKKLQQDKQR
jgi:hypothetical protein